MPQISNDKLNEPSKEIPSYKEGHSISSNQTEILRTRESEYSLEEAASRAIEDAIKTIPGVPEDLTLSSQRALEAADNISSVVFSSSARALEEILKEIEEWVTNESNDKKVFYEIVYKGALKLMRLGDFYSLDALHARAIETAKGEKKILN